MSSGPSCVNIPITTRKSWPDLCSLRLRSVTSLLTFTKSSYSFCSRVNIFTSMEPLTESVSSIF